MATSHLNLPLSRKTQALDAFFYLTSGVGSSQLVVVVVVATVEGDRVKPSIQVLMPWKVMSRLPGQHRWRHLHFIASAGTEDQALNRACGARCSFPLHTDLPTTIHRDRCQLGRQWQSALFLLGRQRESGAFLDQQRANWKTCRYCVLEAFHTHESISRMLLLELDGDEERESVVD